MSDKNDRPVDDAAPSRKRDGEMVVGLAERLRIAILNGEFAAGEGLTEVKIINAFACSRTSAREALRLLLPSGLVEKIPNQRYRVAEFDQRDLYELASMRLVLELLAASIAFKRPAFASGMADAIQEMRDAHRDHDMTRTFAADRHFHEAIIHAADHRRLEDAYSMITDQVQLAFNRYRDRRQDSASIVANHEVLYDKAVNGSIEAFLDELTSHVQGGLGVALRFDTRKIRPNLSSITPLSRDLPDASTPGSASVDAAPPPSSCGRTPQEEDLLAW